MEAQQEEKSLRVLLSIMVFHPVVGGTEQQAKDLATALVRRGHEVEVVTLRQRGCPIREALDGVMVFRSLWGVGRNVIFAASYVVSLAWFLIRRRRRYDVIQVYFAYLEAVTVSLLRPWMKGKTMVRFGGGNPVGDLSRLRRLKIAWLFLPLIRRLDGFIVVSERMRDELVAAGFDRAKITLIRNGVDTRRFAPQAGATDTDRRRREKTTVVTVARLSPEKGIDVLLEAWRRISVEMPQTRLVVVGDGPERDALKRLAERASLNGAVRFVGEVTDVRPYLTTSDLFILPSRSEGLPNALLQAMAVELPCIASRVGGIPEVIEDRMSGRLVEAGNPDALATAVLSVLRDPESARRYGRAARETVEARFALDPMVERYLTLYHHATRSLLAQCR